MDLRDAWIAIIGVLGGGVLASLADHVRRQDEARHRADERAEDLTEAAEAWVAASGQVEIYGSEPARTVFGARSGVPVFPPGDLDEKQREAFAAAAESLVADRRRFAEIAAQEVDEIVSFPDDRQG